VLYLLKGASEKRERGPVKIEGKDSPLSKETTPKKKKERDPLKDGSGKRG